MLHGWRPPACPDRRHGARLVVTESLKRKLAAWSARVPAGSRPGSLAYPRNRERLLVIIEGERAQGTLPDLIDLRRYLIGTLGIALTNADDICELFGKFQEHQ